MQALSQPQVAYSAAGLLIALQTFSWLSDRFGGYAGQLQATDALTMLEEENSLLLDIRQDP